MVIGEDVAVGADDNAGTQAETVLRFVIFRFTKEKAETRVIKEGVGWGLDDGAGKNIYHGGHGFLRGGTQPHSLCLPPVCLRCVFIQGDHTAASSVRQKLRLEGVNNKQQRQRDGDGLGEQKPVFTHVMMNPFVSNSGKINVAQKYVQL